MATKVFFRQASDHISASLWSSGDDDARLDGNLSGWTVLPLSATQGASVTSSSKTLVAGPTSGQEIWDPAAGFPRCWISPPLAADVTISSIPTFNIRCAEDAMATNAGAQVVVERVNSTGAVVSQVINSEQGVEMVVTTETAQNWTTGTVTSTNFLKGDRIRIRVAANDVGTMAAGSFTFWWNGAAGATGDSYVSFVETLTFITTNPTGTTLYPTDTAGEVDPNGASYDSKDMWSSRGAGVQTAVTLGASGWTAPLLCTTTTGGNFVEWFSHQLSAVTLGGAVLLNLRGKWSAVNLRTTLRAELAICDSAGANPVIWAGASHPDQLTTAESVLAQFYMAGDDTTVSDGQRLRLRVYLDDSAALPMLDGGFNTTFYYAATSGGASGDSYLTFTQTLTEFVAGAPYVWNPPRSLPGPFLRAPSQGPLVLAYQPMPETPPAGAVDITISPAVALATADALVPTLVVTVLPATAAGTAVANAPTLVATVLPAVATGTAAANVPTLIVSVLPAVAAATAAGVVPVLDIRLLPSIATATADALAPTLAVVYLETPGGMPRVPFPLSIGGPPILAQQPMPATSVVQADITITPTVASATADALLPTLVVTVLPAIAAATGAALTPTIQITLAPAAASATASGLVPTLVATVLPGVATATAVANAPTLAIAVLPAVATGTAVAPTPAVIVTLLPAVATATADGLVPTFAIIFLEQPTSFPRVPRLLSPGPPFLAQQPMPAIPIAIGDITIAPAAALASASGLIPTLQVVVLPAIAAATATANTPTLIVTLLPATAAATGSASVPALQAAVLPAVAASVAAGLVPTLRVTLLPPIATATGSALTPTVQITIVPGVAAATASGLVPNISIDIRILPPVAAAMALAMPPTIIIGTVAGPVRDPQAKLTGALAEAGLIDVEAKAVLTEEEGKAVLTETEGKAGLVITETDTQTYGGAGTYGSGSPYGP